VTFENKKPHHPPLGQAANKKVNRKVTIAMKHEGPRKREDEKDLIPFNS
jgi:hypothetical protein